MTDTILLDVGWVPVGHLNCCLERLHKALAEDPDGDDASIWAPVANPWLRAHVEAVTVRLSGILFRLQEAFSRALFGDPLEELKKAEVPWQRWSAEEMAEVRFRLEQKPTSAYTLEDWLQLVEWLIARYLPEGVINTEAEYLTVKSALLGKMQATMDAQAAQSPHAERLLDLVPTTFRAVPPRVLRPIEVAILRVARARAADAIENVSADARHRMRQIVCEHVQGSILGQSQGQAQSMRQRLFDEFGQLNRDFRKIAVTESGEVCNQGVVAAMPAGQALVRREAYRGACEFCRSINGRMFTVVAPDAPEKDGATQVWLGKTNIGRSASPRRRAGNALVEREPNEMWWPAAGVQHPHCRGSWQQVTTEKPPEVSQEYAGWLKGMIAAAQAGAIPKS